MNLPSSEAEQRVLAQNLPLEIVREEARRRGLLGEVGAATIEAGGVALGQEPTLKERVNSFFDSEATLSLADQLSVSAAFWKALGHQGPPELPAEQSANLEKALNSGNIDPYRVVPTPLMSPTERAEVVKRTNALLPKKLSSDLELVAPDQVWEFAELVKDPNSTVQVGDFAYTMGYKTSLGALADRETYVKDLLEQGHAIKAEDGTVWTFPLVDVRSQAPPRDGETALRAYESVGFSDTPETLLAVQLLRLINGSANTGNAELDITNEGIFELDNEGRPKKLAMLGSIAWVNALGKAENLYQNFWHPRTQSNSFGFRATVTVQSLIRFDEFTGS